MVSLLGSATTLDAHLWAEGLSATDRAYFEATVNLLVKVYAGMDFDRGDCGNLKERTFPVPQSVAAAYRKAIEEAAPSARNQLLLLWSVAGDEEAERRMAEVDARIRRSAC